MAHLVNGLQLAKHQANAIGSTCLRSGLVGGSKVSYSAAAGSVGDVKKLRTTELTSFGRGTGGRSSFNGTVVTIFGSTGFLGPMVGYNFGKVGSQIIYGYRGDFYPAMRLKPSADLGQVLFQFCELRDDEAIRKAMKYSNVVVNLVGRFYETNNFTFEAVHVDGARRIAKAAREMGVERLIHLSAMNASPNPEPKILPTGSRFLKSKYYGELAVMEEFPNATIIRPADMYGEADNFLWYYQHLWRRIGNTVPLWKKGEHTIKAPVYAGDVAKAIVNAAFDPTTAGQIYQGVGPEQFVLADLVDYMYQLMRKQGVWGYKRTDLRYDPITQLKALVTEKFTNGNSAVFAGLSRERLEREHVDDIIDNSLPTLEDLDVKLATIDDKFPFFVKGYTAFLYYLPEPDEFPDPKKPKPVEIAPSTRAAVYTA